MKYAKPELTPLGRAAAAIQSQGKVIYSPPDNQPQSSKRTVGAYEADE